MHKIFKKLERSRRSQSNLWAKNRSPTRHPTYYTMRFLGAGCTRDRESKNKLQDCLPEASEAGMSSDSFRPSASCGLVGCGLQRWDLPPHLSQEQRSRWLGRFTRAPLARRRILGVIRDWWVGPSCWFSRFSANSYIFFKKGLTVPWLFPILSQPYGREHLAVVVCSMQQQRNQVVLLCTVVQFSSFVLFKKYTRMIYFPYYML
jgi:hypothetical protein